MPSDTMRSRPHWLLMVEVPEAPLIVTAFPLLSVLTTLYASPGYNEARGIVSVIAPEAQLQR